MTFGFPSDGGHQKTCWQIAGTNDGRCVVLENMWSKQFRMPSGTCRTKLLLLGPVRQIYPWVVGVMRSRK